MLFQWDQKILLRIMRSRFNPRSLLSSNLIPKVSCKLKHSWDQSPCFFSYSGGCILFLSNNYPRLWWCFQMISKWASLSSSGFGVTTTSLVCESLVRPRINDKPKCSVSQNMAYCSLSLNHFEGPVKNGFPVTSKIQGARILGEVLRILSSKGALDNFICMPMLKDHWAEANLSVPLWWISERDG